jgi:CBS domain-containing protein
MRRIQAILGNRETVTVDSVASILDAARVMAAHGIGAVPILEGDRLVGIFTERDILARVVAAGIEPAATKVGDVMSTQLVTAHIDESYEVCLERMHQAHVRHLIVLSNDRMVGILSLRDLMAVDLDEKGEHIALLNAYVR